MASGDLISRIYSSFRGVDFRGEEINLVRSPDSLNVWRNYKKTEGIETRPGMELLSIVDEDGDKIFGEGTGRAIHGIYFYNDVMILHCGRKLYSVVNGVATDLNVSVSDTRSDAFIFNNLWYFKDGTRYLQYDGEEIKKVTDVAHIPTTTIGRKAGALSGGTVYEDVNMLSDYRINTFVGIGEREIPTEKTYTDFYLDVPEFDAFPFSLPSLPEGIDITTPSGMAEFLKFQNECAEYFVQREDFLCNLIIDGKPICEAYTDEEGARQLMQTEYVDANGVPYVYNVYFYKNGLRISIDGETNLEEIGEKGSNFAVVVNKNTEEDTATILLYYRATAGTYPVALSYKAEGAKEYTTITLSADSLPFNSLTDLDGTWCFTPITLSSSDSLPGLATNTIFKIVVNEEEKKHRLFDRTSELSGDTSGNIIKYVGGNKDLVIALKNYSKLKSSDTLDNRIRIYPAPPAPLTDGQDNVSIMFKKTNADKSKILNCTLLQVFDNRVFFSGNPDYPNMMWHCSLNDPTYCSDLDYYNEGLDRAEVKGMVAGNNALWVFKEPSQANTSIFYHTPATDAEYGKIYPNAHSSISTGCTGKGINFNDDIVFFSDKGMEGISGDITTEQVIAHRSSLVDRLMTAEEGYENMLLEEWEGYLLVFIGKKVYLADSRAMFSNENHGEYEWFMWELAKEITCTRVHEGTLYLGTEDGLYTLTDFEGALTDGTDSPIESYWVTPKDKFKHPQYLKTSNKRGCTVEAVSVIKNGDEILDAGNITVSVKTEKTDFEDVGTFTNILDYFVCRIKRKKFKDIQLKFSSTARFTLESATLECFIGGYIKR